jgi:hypothetical protein
MDHIPSTMHLTNFLPLLSLIPMLLLAAPVDDILLEKRSGSITFEGCSDGQQKLMDFFLEDMVKLATAGAKASEMPPGSETAAYKAWWGTQKDLPVKYQGRNALSNEKVNYRFEKLQAFMKNPRRDVIFNCNKGTGCTGTRYVGMFLFVTVVKKVGADQNSSQKPCGYLQGFCSNVPLPTLFLDYASEDSLSNREPESGLHIG